jgi:membrane protein required for colicin V production
MSGFSSTSVALIDIFILLLIAWGAFKGFQKGFLTELISIILFFFLLLSSFKLVQLSFNYLSGLSGVGSFSKANHFSAFMIVFFLISLLVGIIDKRMQQKKSFEVFEGLDQFVGLLLGAFKYAFALSVLSEMFTAVGILNRAQMGNTVFYPLLTRLFDFIFEIGNAVSPFVGELVGAVTRMLSR